MQPVSGGRQLLPNLIQFARLLRALGLDVTPTHIHTLLAALELVQLDDRRRFRDAARAVLVGRREHFELFDRAFELFWSASALKPRVELDLGRMKRRSPRRTEEHLATDLPASATAPVVETPLVELRHTYSAVEKLRHKDFAELTDDELRLVRRLMQEQMLRLAPRRTRRFADSRAGDRLDVRGSLRRSLRHGGELLDLAWRKRREKTRPLVVLCDISGSMEPYSRILLQFIYSLRTATDHREAFVFGTRLTRITRQLAHRDVDQALKQAAGAVLDWGGGTRIGEALKRFNYDWARRVLGHGAVVLVISDGWDRGETELLDREVARLARSCDRLLWLNPLLGSPGYEPLTRGIKVILRHVDDFLPVHNLVSLEQLAQVLARLGRPGRVCS